ncbi:hypothetical protein V2G26_013932 [Clonostachys chloroleuca]
MESPACQIIYVKRSFGPGRSVCSPGDVKKVQGPIPDEVKPLLETFDDVYVCATGLACLDKLIELHNQPMLGMKPTLVLIDTPHESYTNNKRSSQESESPTANTPNSSTAQIHAPDEDLYGFNLLQKIITEARLRNIAKLVVPIPIVSHATADEPLEQAGGPQEISSASRRDLASNRDIIRRCLDLGAIDVMVSPISSNCVAALEISAYRAGRDAAREQQSLLAIKRGRQRSWVGVNEEKPFAYLREAMVSGLMKGICRSGSEDEQVTSAHVAVSTERQAEVARAVAQYHFSIHNFNDDELVVAALVMFRHALSMPELSNWRIPTEQLISFLVACRAAYNTFVPYHNFRHVVDVLQATFNFLVKIGALAEYPPASIDGDRPKAEKSPMASLVGPFEALTLLITAIGHDVGHPGVNNGFLVTLNAPLAQLYNDRSVLESFHCAAYSQILRRHWPSVFEDTKMRNLMISSILATDMGLHFDYMKKLGDIQAKLGESNTADGWNGRQVEEARDLACSLLIKCADISNVTRRFDAATRWMHILSEEFSRQASMEDELRIPSSLMTPPKKDLASLAKSQLGFMNLFAIPLFQGVADIMPTLVYAAEELDINKGLFETMVDDAKAKLEKQYLTPEGTFSPRTMSFAAGMEDEDAGLKQKERQGEIEARLATLVVTQERDEDALNSQHHLEMDPLTIPPTGEEFKGVNGEASGLDGMKTLVDFDPFNETSQNLSGTNSTETTIPVRNRQRCSETTEGSTSGGLSGDWVSQATSSATGKMPMSPSTKGTSIVSRDSLERPSSAPGPEGNRTLGVEPISKKVSASEQTVSTSTGSLGKAEGKALRKKTSRFRMKDFPFFRRHKASSPTCQATNSVS